MTIVRDKGFGVPHIYGDTRPELMFGIGYATAEDRLFFIDVLRHAGQGDLASFAGGANVGMDEQVWSDEPYTQQDLVNQVNWGRAQQPYGPQIFSDAQNYVDGINAYIAKAQLNPLMVPGEYFAIGQPQGPQPFTVEDVVSIATLVGGIFGKGGGDQLSNAILYENLKQKFGREHVQRARLARARGRRRVRPRRRRSRRPTAPLRHRRSPAARPSPGRGQEEEATTPVDHAGFATFRSLVDPSDPEAPTTVRGPVVPVPDAPPAEQGGAEDDRPARSAARCRSSTTSTAGCDSARACRSAPDRRRQALAAQHRHGARPAAPTPALACSRCPRRTRTRSWSAPRTAPTAIRWR